MIGKRVNLLPERAGAISKAAWLNTIAVYPKEFLVAFLVLYFGVLSFIYLTQEFQSRSAYARLGQVQNKVDLASADLERQRTELKKLDQEYGFFRMRKAFIDYKAAYLFFDKLTRSNWADVLKELKRLVPEKVWLSGISSVRDQIVVQGGALDGDAVTRLMENLRSSPHFADVRFNFTERGTIDKTDVVNFEVACRHLRPRPASLVKGKFPEGKPE